SVGANRDHAGGNPLEHGLDVSAALVELQILALEIVARLLQLALARRQLAGHRVEGLHERAELVTPLGLDPVIQAARPRLRAAPRAPADRSRTGRVIRFARYSPIHVALTRIISVIITKTDRYTPSSTGFSTRRCAYDSYASVIRRECRARSPAR